MKYTDVQLEDALTPLEDRILIVLDDEEEETDSGIHLPEGVSQGQGVGATGTVVSIGESAEETNGQKELSLGDRVLFNENIGRHVPQGDSDDEHLLIRKANLLAVLGE